MIRDVRDLVYLHSILNNLAVAVPYIGGCVCVSCGCCFNGNLNNAAGPLQIEAVPATKDTQIHLVALTGTRKT